jgi:hypothetical protein
MIFFYKNFFKTVVNRKKTELESQFVIKRLRLRDAIQFRLLESGSTTVSKTKKCIYKKSLLCSSSLFALNKRARSGSDPKYFIDD